MERGSQRNLDVMWLSGGLMPDLKTIANLPKDNAKPIRSVCRQFGLLCPEMALFTHEGGGHRWGKFKAVKKHERLVDKISAIKAQMERLKVLEERMQANPTSNSRSPTQTRARRRHARAASWGTTYKLR